MIEHLEDEARDELEASTIGLKRAYVAIDVAGKRVEVFARTGRDGEIRFGYAYCGARLERKTLLMLVCPEEACSCRAAVQERWKLYQGDVGKPSARPSTQVPLVRPLFEEVSVFAGNRSCVARPASFKCNTPCPLGAHRAIPMRKNGWDLFERGRYIAGGLILSPATQALVPMLPTIEAAQSWLAQSSLER